MTQQLARKLLKVITTTLTVFISICFIVYSAIQVFRFIDIQPRYDKEETQLFENHRAEFELLNNYVIENFGSEPEKR